MDQLDFLDELESSHPLRLLPELWSPLEIYENFQESDATVFEEDFRLDRKRANYAIRALAADLSAFSNNAPYGGVLLIGVADDGAIIGFEDVGADRASEFEQQNPNCPEARFETRRVGVTNVKGNPDFIVVIRVLPSKTRLIETVAKEAYVRNGKGKRRLTEAEKREVRINLGEIDYEREPCNLSYPAEFDHLLIREYCLSYSQKRGITGPFTNEEILQKQNLGTLELGVFTPNLACAIIFAKDPRKVCPGARIRFQRFSGRDEGTGSNYNLIHDNFIEGPLPNLILEADKEVTRQMRNFTRLDKDGRFHTRPEYPKNAWIEAIVNACVHRSYNYRNMNVFVKMFDDRFVVESPGGFPPPTTSENIYDTHNPRNPHLMEALYYFGFVKCAHEGARRMRDEMQGDDLPPPVFEQKVIGNAQVHVVLRNDYDARKTFVDESAVKMLGRSTFDRLKPQEKMVINYLAEQKRLNVTEAHSILRCDWRTAKNMLDRMVDARLLERVSNGSKRDSKAFYRMALIDPDST